MATAARIAANIANAQNSTGPVTAEGKAASSRNSLTTGLFTAAALIRSGEESIYAELEEALYSQLVPATVLEQNLVEEIIGAAWRLRRCRLTESTLADLDDDAAGRRQASVDRARAQTSRLLHKATAELRRLQTERILRHEVLPEDADLSEFGICDVERVVRAAERTENHERRLRRIEDYFAPLPSTPDFTKQTQTPPLPTPEIARNSPCPCGSGAKYKRCCGKNAPPVLKAA